jgi:hypothetical protein
MSDNLQDRVLHTLDSMRENLIHHVTVVLTEYLPILAMPDTVQNKAERHHQNMASTAQRFHEIVQNGASINWDLVGYDFEWAGRKMGSMGYTWQHQEVLIDSYFNAAKRLHTWSDDERAMLDTFAARVREVAEPAYKATDEAPAV